MRKYLNVFALLACVLLSGMVVSCEKEDDVDGIEMRMRNANNGTDAIILCMTDNVYWPIWSEYSDEGGYADDALVLYIDGSNNFFMEHYHMYGHYGQYASNATMKVASVGKVSGLGGIKKSPSSGWADRISVTPGKGYVVKFEGTAQSGHFCKYARIYVSEWIEGTSGGILGAVIRYEDEWQPR